MNKDAVYQAIKAYRLPVLDVDLITTKILQDISVAANKVTVKLSLAFAARSLHNSIRRDVTQLITEQFADADVHVDIAAEIDAYKTQNQMPSMHKVKNIIAVASGKGGVGKSTTTVNLAFALAQEGAKVGVLDADIYGPSVPKMLGVAEQTRPEFIDEKFFNPVFVHGLQTMSMGYMVTDKTPMVWRGPMASGALQQLLTQCMWHDLDYLLIDMPPGTGDIQLTLAQKVPVTGAVIVTTPQDIATLDAKKGIEMFRKVDIPVLGVVENMAMYQCTSCGHEAHIFGEGGATRIADEYNSELLGALPLALEVREHCDNGKPILEALPEHAASKTYRDIAIKVGAAIAKQGLNDANPTVQIIATDD